MEEQINRADVSPEMSAFCTNSHRDYTACFPNLQLLTVSTPDIHSSCGTGVLYRIENINNNLNALNRKSWTFEERPATGQEIRNVSLGNVRVSHAAQRAHAANGSPAAAAIHPAASTPVSIRPGRPSSPA